MSKKPERKPAKRFVAGWPSLRDSIVIYRTPRTLQEAQSLVKDIGYSCKVYELKEVHDGQGK